MSYIKVCDFCDRRVSKDEIMSTYQHDNLTINARERFTWEICPECHEKIVELRKLVFDEENPIFASRCQTGVSKGSKVRVEAVDDGQDELLDGDWVYKEPTWFLSCGHEAKGKERPNFCPVCGKEVDGE